MKTSAMSVTVVRTLLTGGVNEVLVQALNILADSGDAGTKRRQIVDLLVKLPRWVIYDDTRVRKPNPDTKYAGAIIRATLESLGSSDEKIVFLNMIDDAPETNESPYLPRCLLALQVTAGLCVMTDLVNSADPSDLLVYASLLAKSERLELEDLAEYWQVDRDQAAETISSMTAAALKDPSKGIPLQLLETFRHLKERHRDLKAENVFGIILRDVAHKCLSAMSPAEQSGFIASRRPAFQPDPAGSEPVGAPPSAKA